MSEKPRRLLVTGASGFVGQWAARALAARGCEVHAIGRRASTTRADKVIWHEADLLERGAVRAVVNDVRAERLLHLAWVTDHGKYWDSPKNHEWIESTKELIGRFVEAGGGRVVTAGTCAEYDWTDPALASGDCEESATPGTPQTLYGASKRTIGDWLAGRKGLSWATGRVFFPYGENENPARLVPSVTRALLRGERPKTGPGELVRDFIHVADAGAAFAALATDDVVGPVNIGSGVGTTIRAVVETIARIVGRPGAVDIGALPGRPLDPPRLVGSVRRLREECGFAPAMDLEAGLRRTVEWWRDVAGVES